MDLLGLALQGPTCDKKKIDLRPILESHDNESKDEESSEGITEKELREAQEELSKLVSAEQVQHAMIILRGLRVGATEKENETAVVSFKIYQCNLYFAQTNLILVIFNYFQMDLVTSAIQGLRTECTTNVFKV